MRAWRWSATASRRGARADRGGPRPEPGPGLLRVRVAAAAIGLPDLFMCRGNYPLTPTLPFTPGQELCGVVTAAGTGARARPGERVMAMSGFFVGHGAFAEEAIALDDFCFPVPDGLDDPTRPRSSIAFHTAYIGLVRRGAQRAARRCWCSAPRRHRFRRRPDRPRARRARARHRVRRGEACLLP